MKAVLCSKYGVSEVLQIKERMKTELSDIREKRFFMGAYYFCVGKLE